VAGVRADRELVLEAESGGARGDGLDHARVDLDGGDARHVGREEARGEVARAGADLEVASPGRIAARRTMESRTRGLVSRCCPRGLWSRKRPSHASDADAPASGDEEVAAVVVV